MINKNKISFTGYYGMDNFGDDLFVFISNWGAKFFWGNNPKFISKKVNGIEIEYTSDLFSNLKIIEKNSTKAKLLRMFYMIYSAVRSDYLIYSGGSTLSTLSSLNMMKIQYYLSRLNIVKLGGIGVSYGPFFSDNDKKFIDNFINQFEFISFRDSKSYNDFLKNSFIRTDLKATIVNSKDLAGLLPLALPSKKSYNGKRKLGISLCNYESYNPNHYNPDEEKERNESIFEGILSFLEKNTEIEPVIYSLNNNIEKNDDDISYNLQKYLFDRGIRSNVIRYIDIGIEETWFEIQSCSLFFSVRLHGGIPAFVANIPFCLVEYHDKCTEFLNDIGQPEEYRLARVIKSSYEVENVLNHLNTLQVKPALSSKSFTEQAKLNFTAVK